MLAAEYPNITYQKTMKFLNDKVSNLILNFGTGWKKEDLAANARASRASESGGDKKSSDAADTGDCHITFEMWTRILKQESEKVRREVRRRTLENFV